MFSPLLLVVVIYVALQLVAVRAGELPDDGGADE